MEKNTSKRQGQDRGPRKSDRYKSVKNKQRKKYKKKKGKIVKSRLFLVLFIIFLIIFTISRLVWSSHKNAQEKIALEALQNKKSIALMEEKKRRVINVAIDAARGGKNQGMTAYRGNQKEKDINLEIAKYVKDNLSQQEDINVIMVRAYDEDKKIEDRIDYAKKNQADIYISIRLNAQASKNDASGIDTYYVSPENIEYESLIKDKDRFGALKEDKTNKMSKGNNSEERVFVGKNSKSIGENNDLARVSEKNKVDNTSNNKNSNRGDISSNTGDKQGNNLKDDTNKNSSKPERINLSKLLAQSLQNTTISYINMRDRGVEEKKFDILKYTKMPAAIIQCGFISNKDDAEKLEKEKYQEDIAKGISEGILKFVDDNRFALIRDRINYR
nr:N-acetylmuramoyl-L-alanine amidase [uncultured Peptostreptococcus sp.]